MVSPGNIDDAERAADEFDKWLLVGAVERMRQVKANMSSQGVPFITAVSQSDAVQHIASWLLRREIRSLEDDIEQVHEATKTLDSDVKEVHKATAEVDTAVKALQKSSRRLETLTRVLVVLTAVLAIATVAQVILSLR